MKLGLVSLRGALFSDEAIPLKRLISSRCLLAMTLCIFLIGCQSITPKPKAPPSETVSAMTTVTQGLTNKPVSEGQLKVIAQQVAHDPQAQSALRSINTSFSPKQTVKYCPVDGQRFNAGMEYCPVHHVKLEWVDG